MVELGNKINCFAVICLEHFIIFFEQDHTFINPLGLNIPRRAPLLPTASRKNALTCVVIYLTSSAGGFREAAIVFPESGLYR